MSDILNMLDKTNIFFDGAMGTMLQKAGIKAGQLPDLYNITNRETIIDIHMKYIDAGCDVLTTNTFGSNSYKINDTQYSVNEVVSAAIGCAKEAINRKNKSGQVFVACDIGPIGKLLYPSGTLKFDKAYDAYKEIVVAGRESGADLFIVETMSDIYDAKAAILACKENSDLPVFSTMTLESNDRTLTGSDIAILGATLQSLDIDAVGLNCSRGPEEMKRVVEQLSEIVSIPIIIQPNAGLPITKDGVNYYPLQPTDYANAVKKLVYPGVYILGGCCGTTPEHISELINVVGRTHNEIVLKNASNIVCSTSVYRELTDNTDVSEDIVITPETDINDVIDSIFDLIDNDIEVVSIFLKNNVQDTVCNIINEIQAVIKLPLIFKSNSQDLLNLAGRYYAGRTKTKLV